MFYPSYDDYMRDIFYYNGLSGNNMPYQLNSMPSGYMTGGVYMNNMNYGVPVNNNNFNNLYPSIYRIVYPVVQRVTSGGNFQVINDEAVTNATNTIYDIVEGDLSSAQSSAQNNNLNSTSNSNTTQNNSNLNTQNSNNNFSTNSNSINQSRK